MPLVSKGDRITCPNGHLIGTANDSIEPFSDGWFEKIDWTDAAPEKQTQPICKICGAPITRKRNEWGGWEMHFEDGSWR